MKKAAAGIAAFAAAAAGLHAMLGAQWFQLYGIAIILLAVAAAAHFLVARLLRAHGQSSLWALLISLPLALAAVIQAGFWAAFFSSPGMAVNLGVARGMMQPYEVYAGLAAVVYFVAAGLWLFFRLRR